MSYSLYIPKRGFVIKIRRRLGDTLINIRIVRPIFDEGPIKYLPIPITVDDYNHVMNGVDRVSYLISIFSV
jgi:hypothetical protein